jgi:hypothetical protein
LYQYISLCPPSLKKDYGLNVPDATSTKTGMIRELPLDGVL